MGISANTGSIVTQVARSYATGQVTGNDGVGGLLGVCSQCDMPAMIIDSYARGDAVGGIRGTGGLIGRVRQAVSGTGTVDRCYSTGAPSGNGTVGGLIGGCEDCVLSDVLASFWDVESSQIGTADSTTGSQGGTGKSTADMQMLSTHGNAAWSIAASDLHVAEEWKIDDAIAYPELGWQ